MSSCAAAEIAKAAAKIPAIVTRNVSDLVSTCAPLILGDKAGSLHHRGPPRNIGFDDVGGIERKRRRNREGLERVRRIDMPPFLDRGGDHAADLIAALLADRGSQLDQIRLGNRRIELRRKCGGNESNAAEED